MRVLIVLANPEKFIPATLLAIFPRTETRHGV